jgi:hypothetical protein
MKHPLKIFVVSLCIVLFCMAFANPYTRGDNDNSRPVTKIINNQPTPYRPSLRQGSVLFVEDKHGSYGPPVQPDPVWDSVLTEIYGAGNYGWFGPTQSNGDDGPPLDTMLQYELVIWNTYDYWQQDTAALTENDLANVGDYFVAGGMVWLIGQDALWSGIPMLWMDTYFHLLDANQDYNTDSIINLDGLAEISGWSITSIADYTSNDFFTDELIPDTTLGCHAVLEDVDSLRTVGIFYPGFGEWKSAFWAVDGRVQPGSSDWSEWIGMVTDMLDAFGVLPGVAEMPSQKPARELQLHISPVPLVQSATISFTILIASDVELKVFNTAGQHIATIIDDYKHAGSHNVTWNGSDAKGVNVPNGVYLIKLTCGELTITENLVVIK